MQGLSGLKFKYQIGKMLKYSHSTLPCNPRSARKQEELQVQHDSKNRCHPEFEAPL
jgi:hypothetical protein